MIVLRPATVLFSLVLCLGLARPTSAQTPPPLPEGPGTVRGQILHPRGSGSAAGVPVVLYGLSSRGEPGIASTQTDAQGQFVFEGVSNEAEMAYLVAARYRDIPFFGPRIQFEPGSTATRVEIEVRDTTTDATRLSGREVLVQFEWAGGRLAVQEIHRVTTEGAEVLFVEAASRADTPPAFALQLPPGAEDFVAASPGMAEQVEEQDGTIRFWGPLYPGDQELRFQYTVPLSGEKASLTLIPPLSVDKLALMTIEGGPKVRVIEPSPSDAEPDLLTIEQQRFLVQTIEPVEAGSAVSISILQPPSSTDADRIGIQGAEAWIEYDDARVVTNLQIRFDVLGNKRVVSAEGEPLLRIPLPEETRNVDLSPEALVLGAVESDGAVVFHGPFPPGDVRASVRFQLEAGAEGREFSLRFPREVPTLNVLVADTGIAIDSDRLHQRRPFREGTRIYLHREAFHVDPNEAVRVALKPLSEKRLGRSPALVVTFLAIAAAAALLAQPLLRARSATPDAGPSPISMQREALIQDIRDIDHDFETGKLNAEDHQTMRTALRARAVELLREERAEPLPAAERAEPSLANSEEETAPRFCTECGGQLRPEWKFCAHCGAAQPSST